ncbi:MAG: putative flippase GtrA [Patiriisocius sp.]|jgi:putative flippase GtrA
MRITKVGAYRLLRYVLSGIPTQITYWSVFLTLNSTGVYYLISAMVAFVCYWAVNFFFIRYVTFRSEGALRTEMFQHITLHVLNQSLSLSGLYILVSYNDFSANSAQAIMNCVYILINIYVSYRIFDTDAFKQTPPK